MGNLHTRIASSLRMRPRRFALAAVVVLGPGLAISSPAAADCLRSAPPTFPPTVQGAPTPNPDYLICDGTNTPPSGVYDTDLGTTPGANDWLIINGASFNNAVRGGGANDVLVLNSGSITGNFQGDASGTTGTDRLFVFGGTIGGEVQNGQGATSVNDFTFIFGGTVASTVEAQRGSVTPYIIIDGGEVEGLETQNANASLPVASNPTFYLRSGTVGSEPDENWGNSGSEHFIIDPIHSQSAAFWQNFANNVNSDVSTANLLSLIGSGPGSAPANPDPLHLLIIDAEENVDFPNGRIGLGNGDDSLDFVGAVNAGDGIHNLQFGDENEAPLIDGDGQFGSPPAGTPGTQDAIRVRGTSNLELAELINFEFLAVGGNSTLALTASEYSFSFNNTLLPGSGSVFVDGTSTLWLQAPDMTFSTAHLELGGPSGGEKLQPASYYDAFNPGGILRIGAEAQDDDDEGGGGEDEESFLANVVVNTGSSTFVTAGTIDMVNGLAGDRLTVNGPYEAHDANLALDSFVKDKSSPTDRLTLSGPVSGTTTIYVNNVNSGQGAYTGKGNGDGIQLVAAQGLSDDSFRLGVNNISGQREVTSGAFSYQLAIDDSGAYLQSDILDQVPGYVMAGAVADRHVYAGLETLYQRMGELRTGPVAVPNLKDGGKADWKVDSVWARGNFSNYDVDVAKGWDFDSDTNGFLIGVDPSRPVGEEGVIHLGVFAGYNSTDATVDGVTWDRRTPTKVDIDGWTVGGYATFFNRLNPGQGFYADLVGKVDGLDLDINNGYRRTHDSTDAAAYTGSAEIGYGFKFGGGWALQPSGEITFISVDQGNYESKAYGFNVHPEDADSTVGRLGIQLQDTMYSASGTAITPWVNFNVLSEFDGSATTVVGGTAFASDLDGTWYDVGAGITAAWSTRLALYGTVDYKFGDVEGVGGTVGARVHW